MKLVTKSPSREALLQFSCLSDNPNKMLAFVFCTKTLINTSPAFKLCHSLSVENGLLYLVNVFRWSPSSFENVPPLMSVFLDRSIFLYFSVKS